MKEKLAEQALPACESFYRQL